MTEEVRWLDEDERETWLALVGLVVRLPAALDAQLRRDAGLSHFEYQVLAALSMAEDRTLQMTDIARFAESSLSRLSHACSRLEAQGWITRSADPVDKRAKRATLTDAGHAKVVATAPGHVEAVRTLVFDPLTKQQVKQIGDAATRILGAIGAEPC
jgi:DNA-binding MarR family transcriptional regulator